MKAGVARRAVAHARDCGDQCAYWTAGPRTTLCIADGLGHGELAADASAAAIRYVGDHLTRPLGEIFAGCDGAISSTRGVAMAVVEVDAAESRLTYAAVGNTRGQIFGRRKSLLRSDYGIVGGGFRRLNAETLPFAPGDLLVLWTDGIPEFIDIMRYGPDVRSDPQLLADRVITDYAIATDDAAVLAFRDGAPVR